jgi:hypothetical protein
VTSFAAAGAALAMNPSSKGLVSTARQHGQRVRYQCQFMDIMPARMNYQCQFIRAGVLQTTAAGIVQQQQQQPSQLSS